LDPHNEYSRAFGDTAEVIDLRGLQMPYWLFNFQEFCEVLVHAGVSIGMAEAAILGELIPAAKRQFLNSADARHITVDTPSPYRMTLVLQMVDEAVGRLEKPDSLAPYQRLKAGLNAIMSDARFNFMFGGLIAMRDNMATILSRIFRIPVDGKPATILDLSGLPSEILNVVVSVICRMSFDFALWSDGAVPILLVCEEAHRYAPEDSRLGFEPTKRALSRIAKEGRKYGLSLCVVTQRPSELAAGMLSQCNTIFALRLGHQRDQDIVRAAMSESAFGLLDALPSLGNAEAIAVGEGVSIPMRLAFDMLPAEHRPKSGTANFSSSWQKDTSNSDEFLGQVIDNWRRQRR
ncbi:MAG: ATP-binding protein, partial [Methylocella sp.]